MALTYPIYQLPALVTQFFLVERHDNGAIDGNHNGIISQLGDAAAFSIMYSGAGIRYGYYDYQSYSSAYWT